MAHHGLLEEIGRFVLENFPNFTFSRPVNGEDEFPHETQPRSRKGHYVGSFLKFLLHPNLSIVFRGHPNETVFPLPNFFRHNKCAEGVVVILFLCKSPLVLLDQTEIVLPGLGHRELGEGEVASLRLHFESRILVLIEIIAHSDEVEEVQEIFPRNEENSVVLAFVIQQSQEFLRVPFGVLIAPFHHGLVRSVRISQFN